MSISEKITKGWASSIVGVCTIIFLVFLFVDNRYFHSDAAQQLVIAQKAADEQTETKLAGALQNQMLMQQKFYADQQKINDMRQLDQLRCSKALLEAELKRNHNDALIREKLGIINTQIKDLEKKLYGIH